MKSINLNKDEFEEITKKPIYNNNNILYRDNNKILKVFNTKLIEYISNKRYVLSSLLYYKNDIECESLILPNNLIEVDNILKGYTMDYIKGITLDKKLNSNRVPINNKIKYLKDLGKILEDMKQVRKHIDNFYLNDIHEGNILVDRTDTIHIVDIDSAQIFSSKPFQSKYLQGYLPINNFINKYRWYYGLIWGDFWANENTENYCYIIIILNMLLGMDSFKLKINEFLECLNIMEDFGLSKELTSIFARIYSYDENINPYELLDGMKLYLENNGVNKVKKILLKKRF